MIDRGRDGEVSKIGEGPTKVKISTWKINKSCEYNVHHGYSYDTVTVYLKVYERIDLENSYHKKKKMCNYVR